MKLIKRMESNRGLLAIGDQRLAVETRAVAGAEGASQMGHRPPKLDAIRNTRCESGFRMVEWTDARRACGVSE